MPVTITHNVLSLHSKLKIWIFFSKVYLYGVAVVFSLLFYSSYKWLLCLFKW